MADQVLKDSELWDGLDLEWVWLDALRVDGTYQRGLKTEHVNRIAREFKPRAFGVVVVSLRTDGSYWVLDGQQRCQALRVRFTDERILVPCQVFKGLTHEEEAQLFLDLNANKGMSTFERFRARIVALEPVAVDITNIITSRGLRLLNGSAAGAIGCVSACEAIYRNTRSTVKGIKPQHLADTLDTILNAWGPAREALCSTVVAGVGLLICVYHRQLDHKRLVTTLSRSYPITGRGAGGLRSDGEQWADLHKGTVAAGITSIIIEKYNLLSKVNRLEQLRDKGIKR